MIRVTTPIRGRLGNHLFQVGAMCSYANANGYEAVFSSKWSGNEADSNFKLFQNIQFVDYSELQVFKQITHNYFNYKKLPRLLESSCISGEYCYFQDFKYLNRELLLELFLIPSLQEKILKKYPDIKSRTSIHIRRGDYVTREKIGSNQFIIPSLRYYWSAIAACEAEKFIVFSDDIEWCQRKLKLQNVIYSNDDEDISITAMSMCKNNIISTSTFGWWGAYLNPSKEKKVIAPSKWFKPDSAEVLNGLTTAESNLIPDSWIRIDPYQKRNFRIGLRLKKIRRSLFKR